MAPMPDNRITGVMESWMIGSSEPAGEASMERSKIGRPADRQHPFWCPGEDCPPRRRLTRDKSLPRISEKRRRVVSSTSTVASAVSPYATTKRVFDHGHLGPDAGQFRKRQAHALRQIPSR